MSLVRIAARHCLCEALKGRTLVGDNVDDSALGALNLNDNGEPDTDRDEPFLSIYTDSADISVKASGFDLGGQAETEIYFEWGITSSMSVKDDQTGEAVVINGIPETEANMEFKLDLIGRQITDALQDTSNDYSRMFRELVLSVRAFKKSRIANETDGVRLAAHQLVLQCVLLEEPSTGADILSNPFGELFQKMEESGEGGTVEKAALMRAVLEPSAAPLNVFMIENGMHPGQVKTLGLSEPANE